LLTEFFSAHSLHDKKATALTAPSSVHMFALEGMMNAQRNRGMYLRVGERLAEIRKSRKLAKLRSEGTIQNYEHGRNSRNITRLYDAKRFINHLGEML
jgi:hypothetical protein